MDKLTTKIKKFNLAYKYMQKAVALIDKTIKKSPDADTHLYRITKSMEALQKEIYRQLQSEDIDDNFKKIIRKFKK